MTGSSQSLAVPAMAVRHDYRGAPRFERYSATETLSVVYQVVIDTQVIRLRDPLSGIVFDCVANTYLPA